MSTAGSTIHAFPVYDRLTPRTIAYNLKRNLPTEVRKLQSFLMFRFRPRQDGGRDKVPYYTNGRLRSGRQVSPGDLAALDTFDNALDLFQRERVYNGIGIAAVPHNPVTFLDIDHCFDPQSGALNDIAEELLRWDTYTEFSVGGHGLRLIVHGNMACNQKNHAAGVEVFSTRGYVTLTGIPFGTVKPVRALDSARMAQLRALLNMPATGTQAAQGASETEEPRNIPSHLDETEWHAVIAALKALDPDVHHDLWKQIGMALHSASRGKGWDARAFRLWVQWSQRGSKFENTSVETMRSAWNGFGAQRGVTLATLFYLAKEHGGFDPAQYRRQQAAPAATAAKEEDPFDRPPLHAAADEAVDNVVDEELKPLCTGIFDHVGAYAFIGRAKIGKSRILALMAAMALEGKAVFGFKFARKCRVLAISLEERNQDIKERMKLYYVDIAKHKGRLQLIDENKFKEQRDLFHEHYTYIEWLRDLMQRYKPDLVYLDPLVNMRMAWKTKPAEVSKRVTEQDYDLGYQMQQIAEDFQCVLVFTVHASKRKTIHGAFDPFETVGATSWLTAGPVGSLVIMDMPNFNPLEENPDERKVFSIRNRHRRGGDAHLLLQMHMRNNGVIQSLGSYQDIIATEQQQPLLEIIAQAGGAWVTAHEISEHVERSVRQINRQLHNFRARGGVYQDMLLEGRQHEGWRLVARGN